MSQQFLRDLIALRFLQTSHDEFPVAECPENRHVSATRYCIAASFGVWKTSYMVSGTCARKEGLRTLTSPRREASLFKLGRAFGSGHFLVSWPVLTTFSLVEIFA